MAYEQIKNASDHSLGLNIAFYRKKLGITQDQLAARMQQRNFNIVREVIVKIENGRRNISVPELRAFTEILGIDFNAIFEYREEKTKSKKNK